MSSVIPTMAAVVGSTVSSVVYNSIATAGDLSATTISKSIGLIGRGLGYGASLVISDRAGASIRVMADVGETVSAPAIKSGSKTIALGASIVIGTIAGFGFAGIAHGSIKLAEYATSAYYSYKEPVVKALSEAASVASETANREMLKTEDPEVLEKDTEQKNE